MRVFLIILLISPTSLAAAFLELCSNSADIHTRATIRAIEEAIIDNQEDRLSCEELMARLQTCTSLDLRNKGIVDLRPLSGLRNLEFLYLSENHISDLWTLQDLPKLVLLDLKSNNITDIGALPDFTELQVVLLDGNKIKNILPIKDLFKLKIISLEDNPIFNDESDNGEEIKGLIESLIFFRSSCTLENYAPLDLNDIIEAATILNDMADRGDLSYFRALENSLEKVYVFDNQELWSLLKPTTKKIIIGISHSNRITNFLIKKFQSEITEILSIRNDDDQLANNEEQSLYSKIMHAIENEQGRVERAIQYFIMDPKGTYLFSLADEKPLQLLFSRYASKIKSAKKEHLLAALRVYFSPRFVARTLEELKTSARTYPLPSTGTCRLEHTQD